MEKNLMVVLSNAKPEHEDSFNDWYTNIHIVEVVDRLDGFQAARRYRLVDAQVENADTFRYLAIYEVADGQMERARAAIAWQREERANAISHGLEPTISAALNLFDGPHRTMFFEAISERYREQT